MNFYVIHRISAQDKHKDHKIEFFPSKAEALKWVADEIEFIRKSEKEFAESEQEWKKTEEEHEKTTEEQTLVEDYPFNLPSYVTFVASESFSNRAYNYFVEDRPIRLHNTGRMSLIIREF